MIDTHIETLQVRLLNRWQEFSDDVIRLLQAQRVPMGVAKPPEAPGVYCIHDENERLCYVGQAVGAGGLRDRICRKHLSGDESHPLQRAYRDTYPDREERRRFIKEHLSTQWLQINDERRICDLERLLIWMMRPPLNRQ